MPPLDFEWNIDLTVMELLEGMRLPRAEHTRFYSGLHPLFPEIVAAAKAGESWCVHLVERRYAGWTGRNSYVDLSTGDEVGNLPRPVVESIAYDLAELARRKKEGRDAARTQGGGPEGGVREGVG